MLQRRRFPLRAPFLIMILTVGKTNAGRADNRFRFRIPAGAMTRTHRSEVQKIETGEGVRETAQLLHPGDLPALFRLCPLNFTSAEPALQSCKPHLSPGPARSPAIAPDVPFDVSSRGNVPV